MTFTKYADIYDEFNAKKLYKEEIDFIFRNESISPGHTLNIGAGTGQHDEFILKYVDTLECIEPSKNMYEKATNKKTNAIYHQVSIENFQTNRKFQNILSLFHVVSYLTTDNQIEKFFHFIKEHLNEDGVAIIDCWNTSGVLHHKAEKRSREILHNGEIVTRVATPEYQTGTNVININFDFYINNNLAFTEDHAMRHYSTEELTRIAKKYRLNVHRLNDWFGTNASDNSWDALYEIRHQV